MNSFHNLERALQSEVALQSHMLEDGEPVQQTTKRWDPNRGKTILMRSKEEAQDYRYFPEPDLISLHIVNQEFIDSVKQKLPELPHSKRKRFMEEYGLSSYDAEVLTYQKFISEYFEEVCKTTRNYKSAANWIMGDILRIIKESGEDCATVPITPDNLGELISLIDNRTISGKIAKQVFQDMLVSDQSPSTIVEKKGLKVVADEGAIKILIEDVLKKNPAQVNAYRNGKEKVFGFFMGQIMKASKGKASPEVVTKMLKSMLLE